MLHNEKVYKKTIILTNTLKPKKGVVMFNFPKEGQNARNIKTINRLLLSLTALAVLSGILHTLITA